MGKSKINQKCTVKRTLKAYVKQIIALYHVTKSNRNEFLKFA